MILFLLICHRSERSEVKRSGESMGGSGTGNGFDCAWSGRSLDGALPRGMTGKSEYDFCFF
ncbi:MAG: hypothetical protein NC218_06640 [Acetobacter sp.]|nr:hypothetical protein [Acetobacter sp.]